MKKKIHYTAEYQYRCRMCGEIHTYEIGGWDNNICGTELFVATHGDNGVFQNAKHPVHEIAMVSYHLCKTDKSLGVCDFIGIRKVKMKD